MKPLATLVILTIGLAHVVLAGDSIQLPSGQFIERVDFEQHVAPLLSRLGCNAGSCHGASTGKGGFRLSLFGYDPGLDYKAITEDGTGRVDLDDPASSLLLQKPTLALEHEGGRRYEPNSWEHQVISRWISDGAKYTAGSGRIAKLTITPRETEFEGDALTAQVRVLATYENGHTLDVTSLSVLRVQDESIVSVDRAGRLQRGDPGHTHLIATYNGQPTNAQVLVPRARGGSLAAESGSAPAHPPSTIDRHIDRRLVRLNIRPAPRSSDETFLRRAYLATIGQLPTPTQIRQFVSDRSPDKRTRAIDSLLADPLHASMWATRMCEITGSGDAATRLDQQKWHAWFRERFAANEPYDQIVRGVLCATTRRQQAPDAYIDEHVRRASLNDPEAIRDYTARPTLDLFWQRLKVNEQIDVESITERTAAAFLGVRIECARCHKHPFDRWTQNDHRSLGNVFMQVRFGLSPALRIGLVEALERQRERAKQGKPTRRIPRMREVFVAQSTNNLRDSVTQARLPAKPLGASAISTAGDRRIEFADWLTGPENPFFAANFVNRVWAWYFGVGLVDPVDTFSAGNPASHPELLAELANEFVEHGYDIRRLERQLLISGTWQRGATINESNQADQRNYARSYVRILPAEVVVDAISGAIGDQQRPAVEIAEQSTNDDSVATYFEVFNRPARKLTCDCERNAAPTLRQTMLLLADETLISRIREGYVAKLVASCDNDRDAIEELFLRTLCRWPDDSEREAALEHLGTANDRLTGLSDIMWSLLNTREFITSH